MRIWKHSENGSDDRILKVNTHGGKRYGAGRKSIFADKVEPKAFPITLTPAGHDALARLTAHTGLSRNAILAVLIKRHSHRLTLPEQRITYRGKARAVLSIRLPPSAARRLEQTRYRTGHAYSDIGEALIRRYGHTTSFPLPTARKL
jgi:hypothetical protein